MHLPNWKKMAGHASTSLQTHKRQLPPYLLTSCKEDVLSDWHTYFTIFAIIWHESGMLAQSIDHSEQLCYWPIIIIWPNHRTAFTVELPPLYYCYLCVSLLPILSVLYMSTLSSNKENKIPEGWFMGLELEQTIPCKGRLWRTASEKYMILFGYTVDETKSCTIYDHYFPFFVIKQRYSQGRPPQTEMNEQDGLEDPWLDEDFEEMVRRKNDPSSRGSVKTIVVSYKRITDIWSI